VLARLTHLTALMLIAFVYNNNLAYMLAFLLASVFFITILHTYKSLAGLTVQEGQAHPVFAGEAVGFGVHIDNPTSIESQHVQVKMKATEHFSLKARSKALRNLYELTEKHGWHQAGTITIFSTYPLGLFRVWSPIRFNTKALVYPKPATQEIPFPETGVTKSQQGRFKKGGDEFYGLQSYQAGDPGKPTPKVWACSPNNTAAKARQKSCWIMAMPPVVPWKNG
jgi:uncharacterized protein (DUF58 family)